MSSILLLMVIITIITEKYLIDPIDLGEVAPNNQNCYTVFI